MHKIFGIKENVEYTDRKGAYLILVKDNSIGVIQTPKGYFLISGGLEDGENHIECIKRECIEEAGYDVSIKEKLCSAETYCKHDKIGYFHPIQTYYIGGIISKVSTSCDNDHNFVWIDLNQIRGKMFAEMQNWAIEECLKRLDIKQTMILY